MKRWLSGAGLLIFLLTQPTLAQSECVIKQKSKDGSSVVIMIDGKPYLAMPQADMLSLYKKIKKKDLEIKTLEKENHAKAQLIKEFETSRSKDKELITLQKDLIKQLKEMKEGYQKLNTDYTGLNSRYKDLTGGYEEITTNYKDISERYRDLVRGPTFSIDIGVGMTGNKNSEENSPLLLFGVGARRMKLWGFWQEDNTGAALGVTLPLF